MRHRHLIVPSILFVGERELTHSTQTLYFEKIASETNRFQPILNSNRYHIAIAYVCTYICITFRKIKYFHSCSLNLSALSEYLNSYIAILNPISYAFI